MKRRDAIVRVLGLGAVAMGAPSVLKASTEETPYNLGPSTLGYPQAPEPPPLPPPDLRTPSQVYNDEVEARVQTIIERPARASHERQWVRRETSDVFASLKAMLEVGKLPAGSYIGYTVNTRGYGTKIVRYLVINGNVIAPLV